MYHFVSLLLLAGKQNELTKMTTKRKKTTKKATRALVIPEEKPEKPLVLTDVHPLSNKQLMHMLQRTPAEHIYTRPAKGGGTWDYVTGTYVKKVLNYTFGWAWSFEVKDKGREGKLVWVLGKLTIVNPKTFQPMIVKEQFGRADLKTKRDSKDEYLDYGNDLKAASTDALKKCAAELGIASDIYGKNEFREVKATGGKVAAEQPAPVAPKAPEQGGVDYKEKLKVAIKWTKEKDWSLMEKIAKRTGMTFDSISKMSQHDAQVVIAKLLTKK